MAVIASEGRKTAIGECKKERMGMDGRKRAGKERVRSAERTHFNLALTFSQPA